MFLRLPWVFSLKVLRGFRAPVDHQDTETTRKSIGRTSQVLEKNAFKVFRVCVMYR